MHQYQQIVNKIREIYNTPEGFIPLHAPVFMGNEKKYLNECIDSTFVSSVGKFVDRFEEMTAEYTGAKKAVVCVNGTNALQLALQLVGVEREDEVITQALTFIATANAISYCGAKPVFIDVDKDTMGLSPTALKNWLSTSTIQQFNNSTKKNETINKRTGKRISACLPMHTFGHPCRIDKIIDICNEFNIPVVEDAAESLGSFYKGKHTGTFSKIGILSFNGNKTITTGGGGMLLFNDEELALHAKHITTQAKIPHPWEFAHDEIGYNFRMPNINAALGCAQMENIEKIIENKHQTAKAYNDFFKKLNISSNKHLSFFNEPANCKSNYWLNTLVLPNKKERDSFLEYTNQNAVMTRPIWKLLNSLPMFKECQTDNLVNSFWFEERVVNIPSSVH
jgi:perosamine synthetase